MAHRCRRGGAVTPSESLYTHSRRSLTRRIFVKDVISFLRDNNLIIPAERLDVTSFRSRQKLFYEYNGADSEVVQKKLSEAHICLLGAGGIGNHAAFGFASAGVGKITIIDGDIIESSNLTRQFLFEENDIGGYKTKCLQRELNKRFSDVVVETKENYVDERLENVPDCDIIFVAADKPRNIMVNVTRACNIRDIPHINSGYLNDIAVVGPLVIPGRTGCIFCGNDIVAEAVPEDENTIAHVENLSKNIDRHFQTPSIWPLNAIASGYAVQDTIKHLGEFGRPLSYNKRLGFHSVEARIETQECRLDKDCKECRAAQQRNAN